MAVPEVVASFSGSELELLESTEALLSGCVIAASDDVVEVDVEDEFAVTDKLNSLEELSSELCDPTEVC